MNKHRTLRVAGTVAALAAAGAVIAGGTIATAEVAKGPTPVVKIKGNGHPRFEAPETMLDGQDLEIVNKSNPNQIGPHTFSLVEKSAIPKGKDEIKRCAKIKDVCKDIAVAHEVDPQTFEVGEPNVERGAPGWDTSFDGEEAEGDTWYTETKDETTSRQVLVTPGNLWFMCVVHPDMRGKIEVLPVR